MNSHRCIYSVYVKCTWFIWTHNRRVWKKSRKWRWKLLKET